jgi:hypothetical protein
MSAVPMDELRFRNGGRLPQPAAPPHDPRSTLPRRFTAESGLVPTLSTLPGQRAPDAQDFSASQAQAQALHKVQLLERKRVEYEKIREQKRRFEVEMQKLDQQQRREEQELAQMTEDLGRFTSRDNMAGHLSEPTTPPEYRETATGFPTMFSRPNRYSTSSLTSPPGLYNRQSRSGSQVASPQSGVMQSRLAFDDQLPSRSVPGSRRNSDEDEKEEAVRQDPTSYRATSAYVHPLSLCLVSFVQHHRFPLPWPYLVFTIASSKMLPLHCCYSIHIICRLPLPKWKAPAHLCLHHWAGCQRPASGK